jgi:hypothetical protein
MNALSSSGPRKMKLVVGAIAITFLLLFTILALAHVLSLEEWLIADFVVALAANLILRAIGRQRAQ